MSGFKIYNSKKHYVHLNKRTKLNQKRLDKLKLAPKLPVKFSSPQILVLSLSIRVIIQSFCLSTLSYGKRKSLQYAYYPHFISEYNAALSNNTKGNSTQSILKLIKSL